MLLFTSSVRLFLNIQKSDQREVILNLVIKNIIYFCANVRITLVFKNLIVQHNRTFPLLLRVSTVSK